MIHSDLKKTFIKFKFFLIFLYGNLAPISSQAQTSLFTDTSSFVSGIGSTPFYTLPVTQFSGTQLPVSNPFTSGPTTYTGAGGITLFNDGFFGNNVYYVAATSIANNNLSISLSNSPKAVAFYFGHFSGGPGSIIVTVNGLTRNILINGTSQGTGLTSFIGILSSTNINNINIANDPANDSLEMDILFFANGIPGLPLGPTTVDTQLSLQNTINTLKGIYALQNSAISSGLTYDCNMFDLKGICISTGGRYNITNKDDLSSSNSLLIGSYKFNEKIRIGAWADQNITFNKNNLVNLNNDSPMFGMFGVWNKNSSGDGLEAKFSAAYSDSNMTVTRTALGTSEAGSGSTKLNTQGLTATLSNNIRLKNNLLVSPYLGIRYTKIKANSYSESNSILFPLTYSDLVQESYAYLAGVRFLSKLSPVLNLYGSIGIEQDFKNKGNNYSASGINGLTDISFNNDINKTKSIVSIGTWYAINKNQRIDLNISHRSEANQSINSTSAILTFVLGM